MAYITDTTVQFGARSCGNFRTASVTGGIAVFANGGLFSVNHGFTPTYELNIGAPTAANVAAVLATFLANYHGYGK